MTVVLNGSKDQSFYSEVLGDRNFSLNMYFKQYSPLGSRTSKMTTNIFPGAFINVLSSLGLTHTFLYFL